MLRFLVFVFLIVQLGSLGMPYVDSDESGVELIELSKKDKSETESEEELEKDIDEDLKKSDNLSIQQPSTSQAVGLQYKDLLYCFAPDIDFPPPDLA